MRTRLWKILGLSIAVLAAHPALAQTYALVESPREGECFRIYAVTTLTGELRVTRDAKSVPVKITAKNEHTLLEKTLATEKGLPRKTSRHYLTATAQATLAGDPVQRTLSADRKLIVAERTGDALFCYSPAGPLTRNELEVVSEHFETLYIPGVLPTKEVQLGETWKIEDNVVQALCLFDGLISHDLAAKLKEVDAKTAVIAITGPAKGIENGALANLTIAASLRYDFASKRIVSIEWSQKDSRDQGPASPAAEVETKTVLKRELLAQEPAELNAAALAQVPSGSDLPASLTSLVHRDPAGRYQFLHSRDWFMVAQTDHHLVMRLLDRGDFVAQATVTMWTKAGVGKHMTPAEFEKLVGTGTGWKIDQIMEKSEVPTDSDRWAYRITASGELEGTKVAQNFYVLAGAAGEQIILTFTMKPASASKIGTRDLAILNAVDFPKK
jgi:hypothetical protein